MKLLPHMRCMFQKERAGVSQHTTDVLFALSANRKILLLAIVPIEKEITLYKYSGRV